MTSSEDIAWELAKLAALSHQQGNKHAAFELFSNALSVNPIQWQSYKHRGLIYAEWGNYQKALEDLNQALNICLEDPTIDDSVTLEIYYLTGNIRESIYFANEFIESIEYIKQAVTIYGKIIKIDPKHIARYRRGCLLYQMARKADYNEELLRLAVKDFDFILQNEPEDMDETKKADAICKRNAARSALGDMTWLLDDGDA
jgi:tetratricopeptide (TPR) repeat protein